MVSRETLYYSCVVYFPVTAAYLHDNIIIIEIIILVILLSRFCDCSSGSHADSGVNVAGNKPFAWSLTSNDYCLVNGQ